MTPEWAAKCIQIGLARRYMVLENSRVQGLIHSVCPTECALAQNMLRERPDLVVGVYESDVTAAEIRRDLVAGDGLTQSERLGLAGRERN